MSEYLSEEEQLERLRSWWQDYGTAVLVAVVLAVGGYAGWQWYERNSHEQALHAAAIYQSYLDAGDDEARQDAALAELKKDAQGSAYEAFVLLRRAGIAVKAGDLEKAQSLLADVVDHADDELLKSLARLRLAGVLQGLDRSDEALALLDGIRAEGYRTQVLEMKGDILLARGDRAAAHTAYAAAFAALEEGQKDALLEAKAKNTAAPSASTAVDPDDDATEEAAVDTGVDSAPAAEAADPATKE
ncbi:MAG: tetratricopeptide repeat protein [Pseudomonadales bacterium]|nr:tetratricopeptide repeat protein [Pseudomonadales bacterium]